jgi:tetratricopeptide (TPR) repeat protein
VALFLALLAFPVVVGLLPGGSSLGLSSAAAEERETRKTPALREATYKTLSAAQELVDAKDLLGAQAALDKLLTSKGLNAYEIASVHNMKAFVAFSQEDYPQAIRSYEAVLAQRPQIPMGLELATLYALGQLYFVQEDYRKAVEYLNTWFQEAENPGPQPYIFLAQAYYQLQQFKDIPRTVQTAMDIARERDQEIQENWWLLIRAAYYELEDWPKVIEILEVLVEEFPKKDYWVQLSGLYGQENQVKKQVAAIWLAYLQGMLDQEREILNLTGLLLQDDVPYYAARILQQEIDKGVVKAEPKNLQMLAQAWQLAQEVDKAIPAYQEAAKKSDEGELYFRLAQLYLDKDQCDKSVDAAENAIQKGGLRELSQVQLVKGMCQFELKRYSAAIASFDAGIRAAGKDERDLATLRQWKRYVENEKSRDEELKRSAAEAAQAG